MSNIYLIGMPSSGKTTLGKLLAKKLNYEFIDINTEIEKEALMFLDEIIEKHSIKTIHKTEEELLNKYENKTNTIFALNDGVVLNRKNKKLLNGKIIYLDVDELELEKRLNSLYSKKLFEEVTLNTMINDRFLKYRTFADVIINNNSNDINKVIEEIISLG